MEELETQNLPAETPESLEAPSIEDTIRDKWKELSNPEQNEEVEELEQVEEVVEPPKEVKKAPSSWRKELSEKFGSLDPDVQEEILRREQDFHKGIEGFKQAADFGRAMDKAVTPYLATIQGLGVDAPTAVTYLLNLDHQLRHGDYGQKVSVAREIFKNFQIDPNDVFGQQQQIDPSLAPVYQELQSLKAQQQQWHRQIQQEKAAQEHRELSELNSFVEHFAQGKEHFDIVRDDMAALLQAGRAKDLQEAYDMAIFANPQTRATELAKQQEEARAEAKRKAEEAKRAASVNVKTKGNLPTRPRNGTMDETIRTQARALGLAS